MREQIRSQDRQHRLEYGDRNQPDHQHIKGRQAVMDENLVDHNLKEQKRGKGKQLKEKRCCKDLKQLTAVFVDCSEEPCDIEAPAKIEKRGTPRHHDETTIPDRCKLCFGHQSGSRRKCRLNEDFALAGFSKEEKPAILERRNSRQWCAIKPSAVGAAQARLEAAILRTPEHFRNADFRAAKLMPNLRGISPDLVKAEHRHKARKTLVDRTCRLLTHCARLNSIGPRPEVPETPQNQC